MGEMAKGQPALTLTDDIPTAALRLRLFHLHSEDIEEGLPSFEVNSIIMIFICKYGYSLTFTLGYISWVLAKLWRLGRSATLA